MTNTRLLNTYGNSKTKALLITLKEVFARNFKEVKYGTCGVRIDPSIDSHEEEQ